MLVCRFVSPFVSLVGWLLVSMCACVFFGTLRHIFVSYSHFGRPFCAFLALWGALRLHCNAWGSTLPPLVTYFCMFFVLGGTLGLSLLICGLRLGTFGVHFGVFLWLCGRILGPFFGFSGNASKKGQKRREKGKGNEQNFDGNSSFSRKCESAFRLRRRERIEVQAPDFLAPCLNFCSPIFISFF